MTFGIAGFYNGCKQMKPFNPILGETFQAFYPDGSVRYEQKCLSCNEYIDYSAIQKVKI